MMEAQLAKELREATDQLLEIAPTTSSRFPASPHLRHEHITRLDKPDKVYDLPVFSSSSKLEVIHSPTDVRPWQWPNPASASSNGDVHESGSPSFKPGEAHSEQPIEIELHSSLTDDADDRLPSRGLSSRSRSVKAATGDEEIRTTTGFASDDDDHELRVTSPNKSRIRTPVNDIYINQYGERVVQGKVVGRILGGRPRPGSSNNDGLRPASSSAVERPTSSSSLSRVERVVHASSATSDTASPTATSPPAFFLESFPNAFGPKPSTPPASSPPAKKKERRTSKGGPPMILKAPRAVAGALTLASSDHVDDVPLLPERSFRTASDLGSPSSISSKQLSLSPQRPNVTMPLSSSPSKIAHMGIGLGLGRLQLHSPGLFMSPQKEKKEAELLSPSDRVVSSESVRSKIELPALRRPTPTIELSQAKADTVVLHGNRRQARASSVVRPQDEGSIDGVSIYASPTSSPTPSGLAFSSHSNGQDDPFDTASRRSRPKSASEPSSPLLYPRRIENQTDDLGDADLAHDEELGHADAADDDNTSLESAPSSLISLSVSNLTTSSRSPSHHSLERRRNSSSHSRPRPSSSRSAPDIFAREIRIRGWSSVGSQARGWVVFELRIITKQGTPIIAHKRFSSFVKLRSALKEECRDQAKWLPNLPTRRTGLLSKYDAKYLENRRRALQRWLESVALDTVWGSSEALREWVLASD